MKAILATALCAVTILLSTQPATAQDTRSITVSGEGTVDVQPDMAVVYFGVVTEHENPEEARARNAADSRDALNAVRELGIDERKIRLETLRLEPNRRYNERTRNYEEIGFRATRTVRVELTDLDLLPTMIAEIVQKGANRLDRISYDVQDRDAVRAAALREAALNAQGKARLLAETLGATLGPVVHINEQNLIIPRPEFAMAEARGMAMKDAAPEPEAYASGDIEVRATISVVFRLE